MCFDFVVISRSWGRVVLVELMDGCCALRMAGRRCLAVGGCQLFTFWWARGKSVVSGWDEWSWSADGCCGLRCSCLVAARAVGFVFVLFLSIFGA